MPAKSIEPSQSEPTVQIIDTTRPAPSSCAQYFAVVRKILFIPALLRNFATGSVQILPSIPLLNHGLQVFQPHDAILYRVFDHGADQARRDVVRAQLPIAEMGGERQAAVDD